MERPGALGHSCGVSPGLRLEGGRPGGWGRCLSRFVGLGQPCPGVHQGHSPQACFRFMRHCCLDVDVLIGAPGPLVYEALVCFPVSLAPGPACLLFAVGFCGHSTPWTCCRSSPISCPLSHHKNLCIYCSLCWECHSSCSWLDCLRCLLSSGAAPTALQHVARLLS